jgi:hypothetical protein
MTKPLPELLANTIEAYLNVNDFSTNWLENLQRFLNNPNFPERAAQFRQQLAEAILKRTITPNQYEALTDEDFDTPEDLEHWLRELWHDLYDDLPVTIESD